MKYFKIVNISSDGSIYFSSTTTVETKNFITFQLQDDKNFSFYQKTKKLSMNSKHLSVYKKKYFK